MRIKFLPSLLVFPLFLGSCSPNRIFKSQPIDKEWTLESTPNGLDTVGIFFAIDDHKTQTRVPKGENKILTSSTPTQVRQETKVKNVTFGAVVNFLAVKGLDSTASASGQDSIHVNAAFKVNSGTLTVFNDDLIEYFNRVKVIVGDNIKALGLEDSKLYIVTETISSPNVSIIFDKSSKGGINILGVIKKVIGINGHLTIDNTRNSDLVYNLDQPLVVLYKLRQININVIGLRGNANEKVDLTLGPTIVAQEMPFKRK